MTVNYITSERTLLAGKSFAELPFAPSSSMRKMRNVVSKIFHDIWVSFLARVVGYFSSSRPEEGENLAKWRFQQNHLPLNQCIKEYFTELKKGHNNVWIDETFANRDATTTWALCKAVPKEKTKIFIPLIIKGRIMDHIVTLFIDKDTKTMEYFDSKGLTILDRKGETISNISGNNQIEKVIHQIARKFKIETGKENTTKAQRDSHNCGVYVAHYISKKIEGEENISFKSPSEMRESCARILPDRAIVNLSSTGYIDSEEDDF